MNFLDKEKFLVKKIHNKKLNDDFLSAVVENNFEKAKEVISSGWTPELGYGIMNKNDLLLFMIKNELRAKLFFSFFPEYIWEYSPTTFSISNRFDPSDDECEFLVFFNKYIPKDFLNLTKSDPKQSFESFLNFFMAKSFIKFETTDKDLFDLINSEEQTGISNIVYKVKWLDSFFDSFVKSECFEYIKKDPEQYNMFHQYILNALIEMEKENVLSRDFFTKIIKFLAKDRFLLSSNNKKLWGKMLTYAIVKDNGDVFNDIIKFLEIDISFEKEKEAVKNVIYEIDTYLDRKEKYFFSQKIAKIGIGSSFSLFKNSTTWKYVKDDLFTFNDDLLLLSRLFAAKRNNCLNQIHFNDEFFNEKFINFKVSKIFYNKKTIDSIGEKSLENIKKTSKDKNKSEDRLEDNINRMLKSSLDDNEFNELIEKNKQYNDVKLLKERFNAGKRVDIVINFDFTYLDFLMFIGCSPSFIYSRGKNIGKEIIDSKNKIIKLYSQDENWKRNSWNEKDLIVLRKLELGSVLLEKSNHKKIKI